jgi:SAM-dependent methyltransferase
MKKAKRIIMKIYSLILSAVCYPILKHEKAKPPFTEYNERATEFRFIFDHIAKHAPVKVLDVGSGRSALPALMANCGCIVTATDPKGSYWSLQPSFNRHYKVDRLDITDCKPEPIFDLVTCVSTLEHIEQDVAAVRNMFAYLKPGGWLLMTFPANPEKFIPDVYRGKKHHITRSYCLENIDAWYRHLDIIGIKDLLAERYRVFTGDYWGEGERLHPAVEDREWYHLMCIKIQMG